MILHLRFADLKVRLKLMILHNLFFVVLAMAVYFAVLPFLERESPHSGSAKWALVLVLATVYVLAVALLELLILPRYIYGPLRLMLDADAATQAGDHAHECIDVSQIPGDEIGQIMRSRNATVCELRRHEEELLHKNELLERQDRLASLGLLSASVAHELNTPLSVLHGSIEKLQETLADPRAQERLARMLRVTARLRRISEALVDFARARTQQIEPTDVHSLVEEAWGLVAIDDKAAEVRFHNRVEAGTSVVGNAGRLVQVFVNLLRNSLGAVPSGGNVTVEARRIPGDGRTMISITVEDDGPGIPAGVLPNIFEAFVTARLDARGTGLGLTVAEGIVNQHGGTIAASNRAGGGARLEVRLPAAD